MRIAKIERNTKETQITLELNLDGTGMHDIHTGIGFYDHMLTQIAVHGRFDLKIVTIADLVKYGARFPIRIQVRAAVLHAGRGAISDLCQEHGNHAQHSHGHQNLR